MTFDVRVRRVSDSLTGKPEHLRADSVDYSASLSEVAALRLQLSQHAKVNGSLRTGEELALEIWDGTRWTEGEQARFTSLGLSLDELDPTMATQLDVVEAVSFRLSKALHDVQSDRTFTDVTPGYIVHTLLTEAKSRGAVEGVSWTFTPTLDSTGTPWPKAVTIDLPPDQSALDTLGVLVDAGYIDWTTRGRELVLYVKENAGRKHPFTVGKRALERPFRSSLTDAATAVTVRLDDGKFIRKAGNRDLGLGVLERAISASGVTDDATANVLLDAELAAGAPKSELTISENAETLDRVPLVSYDLGDWVWVRRAGAAENVRVSGVQVRKAKGESPTIDIILMDKIADNAARLAKAAKAVGRVGGNGRFKGSGVGGGGGVSARYGTVDSNYLRGSGNPVYVDFGTGKLDGPFDFLASYFPAGGDRIMVVDSKIIGRVTAEPGDNPGSVEVLEPGPGWGNFDSARYGDLRISKTPSDWVVLSGVLLRDVNYTGSDPWLICYIPGAYRPQRNSLHLRVVGENGVPGSHSVSLNMQTGALTCSSLNNISLGNLAWNVSENNIWNGGSAAAGGVDSNGTVYTFGPTSSKSGAGTSLGYTVPSGLRPLQTRTLGSTTNSGNGWVTATGGLASSGGSPLSPNSYFPDAYWWQAEDAGTLKYTWQRFDLINGYTHSSTEPLEFAKTPDGIVLMRGLSAGGGVASQTFARLPVGFRPSFEIVTNSGLRITPGGAISGLSTSSSPRAATAMFMAGR